VTDADSAGLELEAVTTGQEPKGAEPAYVELASQIEHYGKLRRQCERWHNGLKILVITLGASVPVLTTADVTTWVVATVGGAIAVVEGISQLLHFHDRYLAARMVFRSLEIERIRYDNGCDPYDTVESRNRELAGKIAELLGSYEARVLTAVNRADDAAT
jgi:hypothetical protein